MGINSNYIYGPKVVVIGGGTGISTMLRGLKKFTENITAIVTVGDDGGGSGELRKELGILPPGDIRNCLVSLANTEPIMKELLKYRFKEGNLKNQNFGNLFIAAMIGISDDFAQAINKVSNVLAITGKVLPVTIDNLTLKAKLLNGIIVEGESNIPKEVIRYNTKIDKLMINPEDAKPVEDCINEILKADVIVLGPGSLYTSILPNLKVKDICHSINKSNAIKIYISNIMTQPGETDSYTLADHVESIFNNTNLIKLDYVIANNGILNEYILDKYISERSELVICDDSSLLKRNIRTIKENLIMFKNDFIRHDSTKLSQIIIDTYEKNNLKKF